MTTSIGAALTAGLALVAGAAQAQVHDASFTTPDGQRTLAHWIDIKGPAACVWRSFVDEGALKASGIPYAHVELKNGGVLEEGFTPAPKPGETIRHQIITYLPGRLLVLRNQAVPQGLPGAELYPNIVQVISIEDREPGVVRLTVAHTGYGQGPGYDGLYSFFREHNPSFLTGAKAQCEGKAG